MRRPDTANPHRSRARALRLLFQAELRGVDPVVLLERVESDGATAGILDGDDVTGTAVDGFTRTLVVGVASRRDELDGHIARFSRGWQIHRMPIVDRTVLRLATYELLHEPTSAAIVIDEAVEFAKGWSTSDSGRFVNGVLESIRRDRDQAT